MRVNRYLAHAGYASRRGADALVEEGRVTINGKRATLGDQVSPGDRVEVAGATARDARMYLAFHKPAGVVTSSPQKGERSVLEILSKHKPGVHLSPIGRLDKASRGLLLLTNDARIIEPLLDPDAGHEKEYAVTVQEPIRRDFETQIEHGVLIPLAPHTRRYRTKPCRVRVRDAHTFYITLTEGKNRQIRKMCAALGYSVVDLVRVRILHIELGSLKPGQFRHLKPAERDKLLRTLALS